MTRRPLRAAACALLAGALAACGAPAGPGPSATPTGAIIPEPPPESPTPSTSASASDTTTASPPPTSPAVQAFLDAVVPELEALDGVDLVLVTALAADCGDGVVDTPSVQVRTVEDPSAAQILAIMETTHEAATAEAPGELISLQISPDAESSAQFQCHVPAPDETVAEVVAEGFAARWVLTLLAPLDETGVVADADPATRRLVYSPNASDINADVDILALLPETWEAATTGSEALGWTYAYFRLGGGMMIDGTIRAEVGSEMPEDLADFWTDWSEFGWDVVGAGAESHPFVSPDPDGGLDVLLILKDGVEELLPEDQADFDQLVERLEGLGLGNVTVTVQHGPDDE